jgi:ferritin-like metal-binding protein YciE
MSNKINPAFQEALREIGRPTSPEDLRRRGITSLRSVRTSEVSLLIERAVNRTLMERTIGALDPEERVVILKAAENQFTRQLRDFHDLADSRQVVEAHRRETQVELARLRESLEERRRAEPRPAAPSESAAELRARLTLEIRACLQPLLSGGQFDGAGRRAVDELLALTERHAAAALEELRHSFKLETENQERRVAKLVASLEQTEKVLARVAASKGLEPGVESVFRSVQGLSSVDSSAEQKKELLGRIFEANMALRQARLSAAQFA